MGSGDSEHENSAGGDRTMTFAALAVVAILAVSFVGIWYGMNADHGGEDAVRLEDGTYSYTATYRGTMIDITVPASITVTDGMFDTVTIDGVGHDVGTDGLRVLDGSQEFSDGSDVVSADRFMMGPYIVAVHEGRVISFTYHGDDISMEMVLDGWTGA